MILGLDYQSRGFKFDFPLLWAKFCLAPYRVSIAYIEDIYFFVVNTKYISLNVLKMSVISRAGSMSEIADIFNTFNEILLIFTDKEIFFTFYFFH